MLAEAILGAAFAAACALLFPPHATEHQFLATAIELRREGIHEFHGYQLAVAHQKRVGARYPECFGSLYRLLDNLEKAGHLCSRLEDPEVAEREGRPRRRLYSLTDFVIEWFPVGVQASGIEERDDG